MRHAAPRQDLVPSGGFHFGTAFQAKCLAFELVDFQSLCNHCVVKLINLKQSAGDSLSTVGCLRAFFFQRWLFRSRYHSHLRLSTGDSFKSGLCTANSLSTFGNLQRIFFQPWVVCGWFSLNPVLSTVDVLSTLGCPRLIFFQPWVVYGLFPLNPWLSTADCLSTLNCLRLSFSQPWAVYGQSAVNVLWTLGCLRLIFCQRWIVYGWFYLNPGLFAADIL